MYSIKIKIPLLFVITLFFILVFSAKLLANNEDKSFYVPIFSLNEKIEKLSKLNELNSAVAISLSESLEASFEQLNPAEQYLYLVFKANNAQSINQYHQTVDYLLQAQSLESEINSDQLKRLPFLNLYNTLTESYVVIGQFKKAYDAQNIFITRYDTYLKNQRDKSIFSLEDKYETHQKKDINTLLNTQTELKTFQIDESLTQEVVQRRNIYILSFLVIVFLFLLIRLLVINKRFYKSSQQDILTGIKNRRTLFSYGKSAIDRSIESNTGLCMLAIKIDDFKLLNDIHGDYIGDELLKTVASSGMEAMRTRDVFARLEDATFIAILPEVSQDEAKAIAQHLKEKISSFNFAYVGLTQQLEMSIAIVELSEPLSNFELLLNTAMNVLYEIRDGGGNQIRIY